MKKIILPLMLLLIMQRLNAQYQKSAYLISANFNQGVAYNKNQYNQPTSSVESLNSGTILNLIYSKVYNENHIYGLGLVSYLNFNSSNRDYMVGPAFRYAYYKPLGNTYGLKCNTSLNLMFGKYDYQSGNQNVHLNKYMVDGGLSAGFYYFFHKNIAMEFQLGLLNINGSGNINPDKNNPDNLRNENSTFNFVGILPGNVRLDQISLGIQYMFNPKNK